MWKTIFVSLLCLSFLSALVTDSFADSSTSISETAVRLSRGYDSERIERVQPVPDNDYRSERSGAEVLTTGKSGTITVTTDGRDLELETFVKQK